MIPLATRQSGVSTEFVLIPFGESTGRKSDLCRHQRADQEQQGEDRMGDHEDFSFGVFGVSASTSLRVQNLYRDLTDSVSPAAIAIFQRQLDRRFPGNGPDGDVSIIIA